MNVIGEVTKSQTEVGRDPGGSSCPIPAEAEAPRVGLGTFLC